MRVHKGSLIERLLYPYVRRIITAYDDARRLNWKHCSNPRCNAPLAEDGANFCHICGTCLVPQLPAPKPVEVQSASIIPAKPQEPAPVTDAMYDLHQRPLQNFIQARQNGAGIRTAMTVAIDVEKIRKQARGKP